MFTKLKKEHYYKVKKLFNHMNYCLEIESVIKRKNCVIFADNEQNPQTACIFNNYHSFYIAGKTDNEVFNDALSKHILNNICPTMRNPDCLDFYIHFGDQARWANTITKIFSKHHVAKINWRYYVFKSHNNVSCNLPYGYELKRVNAELLQKTDLKNINCVKKWISETWLNEQDFLANGFGFYILHNNTIVSWCIADYVVGNSCEIGIETDGDYRRQGLATKAVVASVNHCLANGIKNIGWRCLESNIGSQKTAERVGFRLLKEYCPIFGWYNLFDNYLVHAYSYYCNKNYTTAAELYELAFELIDINSEEVQVSQICTAQNRFWFYFNAARAYVLSGNIKKAKNKLKQSFKLGLPKRMFEKEECFKLLNNNDVTKILSTL